jgi:diguanylate cyclase (GGDEF)-like protein
MKRMFSFFATLSLCTVGAWAQPSGQITTLQVADSLTNAQASLRTPVDFEATVTNYRSYERNLFVQDGDAGIYVHLAGMYSLVPGDRVRVRGTMRDSFRPYVEDAVIAIVGHVALPKAQHPTFAQMIHAETDCSLVTVRALIQSADLVLNSQGPVLNTDLNILLQGGQAKVTIDSSDPALLKNLLDAQVEITGVQSGIFDNKMQQTGILLHVSSLDQVKILKTAQVDPWSIAITPMSEILIGYHIQDNSDRERVHGTVTYDQPGVALVLQDGAKSIWITSDNSAPLHLGYMADAIGFPAVVNGFLTLNHGEVRETAALAPVTPSLFTWSQLAHGGNDGHSHVFDLVSVEGQVVTQVRQATQDEYVLDSDGHLLSAIIRHPGSASKTLLVPMYEIPVGTHIRVTGICLLTDANPFNGDVPFNILMRNVDDIKVVALPPWLNVRHLILLVGLLLAVVVAIAIRSWAMERNMRQQAAALAYVEQRRSRILEDINNSRPLDEIIENITQVASFRLHGAACWCKIANAPSLGRRPVSITTQRIIQQDIPGRSGAVLGTIFAAIHRLNKPRAEESAALALGAGLATLAIETSCLYSDLVHRSEFDLLTDVPNRFSMEKNLHTTIEDARLSAGIVGFIFIDLDEFKQVNDRYGHQVGDMYLQEAARRMKRQLRPGDALARLGGDEFAAVISTANNRAEVLEIALRLERCFDEPFSVGGHVLHGSASVGFAIYPEDAPSADSLLSAADAAMYAVKQSRQNRNPESAAASQDLAPGICA